MPLQVKKVQLKVKDGNEYIDGDLLFNVDAEAWATGKRNGETVTSGDPTYHDNAKYWSDQANSSATAAAQAVLTGNLAPTFSTGTAYSKGDYVIYNGILYQFMTDHAAGAWTGEDVTEQTVDNALKQIDDVQGNFAPMYSTSAIYAVGDYVLYDGDLYECNTAIPTAEVWTAAHWTIKKLAPDVADLKTQLKQVVPVQYTKLVWSPGQVRYDNGTIRDNDNTKHTQFINIANVQKIRYTRIGFTSTSTSNPCGMAFYSADNESAFINGQQCALGRAEIEYIMTDIDVPEGALYARFTKSLTLEAAGKEFALYDADQYDETMLARLGDCEADIDACETDIEAIKSELDLPFESKSFVISHTGFIRYNDGNTGSGSGSTQYTNFINVENIKKIKYKQPKTTNASSVAGMAFYAQKDVSSYITGVQNVYDSSELGYVWNTIDVPNNAKYARFTAYTDTETYGEFEIYGQSDIKSAIEELQNHEAANIPFIGTTVLHLTETDPVWADFDGRPVANGGTPYTAIYDLYDALCVSYPHWIKRNADLDNDSEGNAIAHYTVRLYDPIVGGNGWKTWDGTDANKPANEWTTKTEYRRALLTAGVHGIEKSGVLALYFLIKDIVSSSDSWANFIRSNFILEIVPIICPGNFNANRRENINNVNVNRDYLDKTSAEAQAMTALIDSISTTLRCSLDFHMTHNEMGYIATPVSNPEFDFMMTIANQTSAACAGNWDSIRQAFNIGDQYFPYVFGDASQNEGTQPDYIVKSGITNYAFTVEMPKADGMATAGKSADYVKLSKMGMDMGANLLQALITR